MKIPLIQKVASLKDALTKAKSNLTNLINNKLDLFLNKISHSVLQLLPWYPALLPPLILLISTRLSTPPLHSLVQTLPFLATLLKPRIPIASKASSLP